MANSPRSRPLGSTTEVGLNALPSGERLSYPLPSALGLLGVMRLQSLGQDDHLAWPLIPLLGAMISVTMLTAIVYALTPDERWDTRHNPEQAGPGTGWGPVLAAVAALLVGGATFMGTVAFGGQKFFEWQLETDQAQNSSRLTP